MPLENRFVEFSFVPLVDFRLVALGPCSWTCMAVAGSRDASWHAGVRDHRSLEVDGQLSNCFQLSDGHPLYTGVLYLYTH